MSEPVDHSDNNPIAVANKIKQFRIKNNFLEFVKYTNKDYEANWHHKALCDRLDRFMRDPDDKRLMIFAPPRSGKSEIVSRSFPAYYFGHNPDNSIIATSYGAELAQAMNRDVQRKIDNPYYQDIFPNTTLSGKNVKTTSLGSFIRTSDKFEIVGHKGMYRSAGVGGGITGMGGHVLLIDDPLKDMAEALSPTRKRVVYDWYTSTLYTRLAKGGKIIIILTRWAHDDLAGRLLADAKANDNADQWDILCFPAEYETNHPYLSPEDVRTEEGQLLWPEWFPEDEMIKKKASVGSRVYTSLYQQKPAPDGGSICKLSWIKYFKATPKFKRIMLSVDCSFKDTDGTDYVVLSVFGMVGPLKHLIHIVRDRMDIIETIANIRRIVSRFNGGINYVLVEDKANGPAVISMLKKEISGVIPFNPGRDSKQARFISIAPQIEAGNLLLPDKYSEQMRREYPWITTDLYDIVLDEIAQFPSGAHDDVVDTITQCFLKENKVGGWLTEMLEKEEVKDDLTDQEVIRKKQTKDLANMMGWNIEEEDTDFFGNEVDYYE